MCDLRSASVRASATEEKLVLRKLSAKQKPAMVCGYNSKATDNHWPALMIGVATNRVIGEPTNRRW